MKTPSLNKVIRAYALQDLYKAMIKHGVLIGLATREKINIALNELLKEKTRKATYMRKAKLFREAWRQP